jgi:hypothetical protein
MVCAGARVPLGRKSDLRRSCACCSVREDEFRCADGCVVFVRGMEIGGWFRGFAPVRGMEPGASRPKCVPDSAWGIGPEANRPWRVSGCIVPPRGIEYDAGWCRCIPGRNVLVRGMAPEVVRGMAPEVVLVYQGRGREPLGSHGKTDGFRSL